MGDDLRKYAPRVSTILRETDPRKMEEEHRRALDNPALHEAMAQMKAGLERQPTPVVPMPAVPAAEERPVTKPAPASPPPGTAGQEALQRKVLLAVAAIAAVVIPTALGIAMASRYAQSTTPGTTPTATASASASARPLSMPSATGGTVTALPSASPTAASSAMPAATAKPAAPVPSTTTLPKGPGSSAAEPDDPYTEPPPKRGAGAPTARPHEQF
jgi:hypothetical protein